jgi:hypothetical protein
LIKEQCPKCGYIPPVRSKDISDRFHGWCTFLARELAVEREYIYWLVLLKAVEIEPPEGGSEYPYVIVGGVLIPKRTSERTNKEMMTACRAIEYWVAENHPEIILPETHAS